MSGINVVVGKSPKGVNVDVGNKSGDKNVIEEVQVNGSALPVDEHKAVNVPVPTELSQLTDDASHRLVTDAEKAEWSAKSEFSGNYSDLSGKPFIPTKVSDLPNDAGYLTQHQDLSGYYNKGEVDAALATKQATLVSGTNIKTINNKSLLGGGNIEIEAGDEAVWGNISGTLANQTDLSAALDAKYQKPSGGIPKTDLASAVQTSLGKADTALQSESDPTVPSWAKAANPPTEVFVAEYGVTTTSELITAANANKTIFCVYNNKRYDYNGRVAAAATYDFHYFIAGINGQSYYVRLRSDNDTWSNGAYTFEKTTNLRTSWQSTPDNTHYPSEKLVKDSLDAIHQIPSGGTSGQVLSKASGTDYDTEWVTPSGGSSDAVQYTPQTLTDAQKAQARVNIQTLHANFGETITPVTTGAETTQNKAQTLVGNETDTTKYPCTKAVTDALGKWGVVSQTQTWTGSNATGYDYTMSNQVYGLIPQANIDLYEAAGAVFNATTGYFKLNGLTDISYEEMKVIYAWKRPKNICDCTYAISSRELRTNFSLFDLIDASRYGNAEGVPSVSLVGLATYSELIRVISIRPENRIDNFANWAQVAGMSWAFTGCVRLKEVVGVINTNRISSASQLAAFEQCYSLEDIFLNKLKYNVNFSDSSRLSVASILFMINRAQTTAITITLHPTAYARAIADADVQTALSNHTNVTLASA